MRPRVVRSAGIGFVLLTLVGEMLKGDSPSPTGPAATIVDYLEDGRTGILAGAYVQMIGLALFATVVVAVVEHLLSDGRRLATRFVALGGALTVVAYTTYVFLTAALAFGAGPDAGEATAKALWEIRFVSETFISFPAALLVGSVAAAGLKTGAFPRLYSYISATAAAAFLIGGATFARNGSFAPDGDWGFLLFWLLPIWVAVTAFKIRRPPERSVA